MQVLLEKEESFLISKVIHIAQPLCGTQKTALRYYFTKVIKENKIIETYIFLNF